MAGGSLWNGVHVQKSGRECACRRLCGGRETRANRGATTSSLENCGTCPDYLSTGTRPAEGFATVAQQKLNIEKSKAMGATGVQLRGGESNQGGLTAWGTDALGLYVQWSCQ